MKRCSLWKPVLLAATLAACSDSHRAISAPQEPSLDSADDCIIAQVHVDPAFASILQGDLRTYQATAVGARRGDYAPCTITGSVAFTWTVQTQSVAQVTGVSGNFGQSTAVVAGVAPGTTPITVTAALYGTSATAGTSITVVARTPTPTVGAISGTQAPAQAGTYNYTATASGGNGTSYSYTWERRQSGGSWSVVHTASGGATSTAPIAIAAGLLYSVRVRVASGTSHQATSAEYTVDSRGAAAPLSAELSGYDNIRYTGVHTFEAIPSGGTGSYTYYWTLQRPDASVVHGTGKTFSINFPSCEGPEGYNLDVTVTSGSQTASAGTLLNVEIYNC